MFYLGLTTEQDLQPLARIMAESFTAISPEKPWDTEHAYSHLKFWYEKQPDMFWCAYDADNNPVGAIVGMIKPWRTGMRCTDCVIFVDTKYQDQSIGNMLVKKIATEAKEKYNVEIFEAVTFATKDFPMSWFEKLGAAKDDFAILIKASVDDLLNSSN